MFISIPLTTKISKYLENTYRHLRIATEIPTTECLPKTQYFHLRDAHTCKKRRKRDISLHQESINQEQQKQNGDQTGNREDFFLNIFLKDSSDNLTRHFSEETPNIF